MSDVIKQAAETWKAYHDKPCHPPHLTPTDELIEAMKEGFAVRLADVEAKAERYRQALVECARIVQNGDAWLRTGCASKLNDIIMDALK